jgi:uncharacterized protein Yka (UPF0111/DUF47 family)
MGTAKLVEKLEKFFDLSEKKQDKKHHKLLKIVDKLEQKQDKLHREVTQEGRTSPHSERYHELARELDVISGLIQKAKQKESSE